MSSRILRTIEELQNQTDFSVDQNEKDELEEIVFNHPMAVTEYYLNLMDWDDPEDPLVKMAIPSIAENRASGLLDSSGELSNTKIRGLQHKYTQTALLLVTNKCATYCRHCFRKRFVGISFEEIAENMDEIIAYLNKDKEITNVLISGGDPLTLPTEKIITILKKLAPIGHIKFIRIGSRIPVVLPSRISEDEELTKFLGEYSRNNKQIYINTQFNHPKEITPETTKAINKLLEERIIINNQTVLLRGVNDNASLMAKLQLLLSRMGIIPYYVFQCRPVKGVKNIFQVPLVKGNQIISEARKMLDGPSKRFRFVMSHKLGKIEILGEREGKICFRYHQAKDSSLEGKIFSREIDDKSCWLTI